MSTQKSGLPSSTAHTAVEHEAVPGDAVDVHEDQVRPPGDRAFLEEDSCVRPSFPELVRHFLQIGPPVLLVGCVDVDPLRHECSLRYRRIRGRVARIPGHGVRRGGTASTAAWSRRRCSTPRTGSCCRGSVCGRGGAGTPVFGHHPAEVSGGDARDRPSSGGWRWRTEFASGTGSASTPSLLPVTRSAPWRSAPSRCLRAYKVSHTEAPVPERNPDLPGRTRHRHDCSAPTEARTRRAWQDRLARGPERLTLPAA